MKGRGLEKTMIYLLKAVPPLSATSAGGLVILTGKTATMSSPSDKKEYEKGTAKSVIIHIFCVHKLLQSKTLSLMWPL
jgi:hypothetical protein